MNSKINILKNSISGNRRVVFVQKKKKPKKTAPCFLTRLFKVDLHYARLASAQTELKQEICRDEYF